MTVVEPIFKPNPTAMRQHLEHLFGGHGDGFIELAWTTEKPDASGRYPLGFAEWFRTTEIDALVERAVELNSRPMVNVYIGAGLRKPDSMPAGRSHDSDAWKLTCAYVDLDDEGGVPAARELWAFMKPTFIVGTGREPHLRAQAYWKLTEPISDHGAWTAILKAIARRLDGDSTVTNPGRVLRLAGTVAWPQKPGRTTELTFIGQTTGEPRPRPSYDVKTLATYFQYDPAKDAAHAPMQAEERPVERKTNSLGLADKITDGRELYMRNTLIAVFIEFVGENGAEPSPEELVEAAWPQYAEKVDLTKPGRNRDEMHRKAVYLLRRFNEGALRGLTTLEEVIDTYRGRRQRQAVEYAAADFGGDEPRPPPSDPARFPFETIGDLRKLPPTKWLVDRWIPETATGIFYGKWAAGKSFIGFDLALHIAYGMEEWHGAKLPEEDCDVLIIAREGHQGFVQRIDAFKRHHGISDDSERVAFMRASVSFMRDEEFAGLCAAIKALGRKFRLVLIDTVARVLPGVDMNEQQTVTLFMERCTVLADVCGGTAIGVHHQNKGGDMMGSIYFEANADFVFEVERTGSEDDPLREGQITCTKMKDGEDRWKRSVRYETVHLSLAPEGPSSLVVAAIDDAKATVGMPPKDICRRVLNVIDGAWFDGKPLSHMPQANKQGRYAQRVLGQQFGLKGETVEHMVIAWLDTGVLSFEVHDKHTKAKGLRVTGGID